MSSKKKPVAIMMDEASGMDITAIIQVTAHTPRGHAKPTFIQTNLCQEIQLPQVKEWNSKMRTNQQRLHDKIIECVALIRKEQPTVVEQILECSEAVRKEMRLTGMHVLTRYIHVELVREKLSVLFQARAVKYKAYLTARAWNNTVLGIQGVEAQQMIVTMLKNYLDSIISSNPTP